MMRKNGLQDNDIGYPNTPVRRYQYRKQQEKESMEKNAVQNQGDQQFQQQRQNMVQMQPNPQYMQQPMMMMQQPMMQNPMQPGYNNNNNNQNNVQMNNPGSSNQSPLNNTANRYCRPEMGAFQESDKCARRRTNVDNGLDGCRKKDIKQFDPQASITKQVNLDNRWPFANHQNQQPSTTESKQYQPNPNQYQQNVYQQDQPKSVSPFTNSVSNPNVQPNFQQQPTAPQGVQNFNQGGDFQNNLYGYPQSHNQYQGYQPMYPQVMQPMNAYQQPSYYMNNPSMGQAFPMYQPQMQT